MASPMPRRVRRPIIPLGHVFVFPPGDRHWYRVAVPKMPGLVEGLDDLEPWAWTSLLGFLEQRISLARDAEELESDE